MVKGLSVLNGLAVFEDAALLAFRILIGSFLIWGVGITLSAQSKWQNLLGFWHNMGLSNHT